MTGPIRDIRLGLSARGPEHGQAVAMIKAAIADAIAFAIVDMTDNDWPPTIAAGCATDYWEDRVEDAFAAGVRRGYQLISRDDLVEEHDQLEDSGESTWCGRCIERRLRWAA